MAKVNELKLDLEELKKFYGIAERGKVKDVLQIAIRKIETELTAIHEEAKAQENTPTNIDPSTKPKTRVQNYETKITNYAWDQSDKFLKIYVTLKGVQDLPKDNVKCEFTPRSMDLHVAGLDGKNYSLVVTYLMNPIVISGSYHKIKTDTIVVFMKKEDPKHWSHITMQEKKAKDTKLPKMEEGDDPSQSLMHLMKQMYDDGDDEMKRTIAKAWTESQQKAARGEYDL